MRKSKMKRILSALTLSAVLASSAWSDEKPTEYICGEPSIYGEWRFKDDELRNMFKNMPKRPFKVVQTKEHLKSTFWGDGKLVGKSYYPNGELEDEIYIFGAGGLLTVVSFVQPISEYNASDRELLILRHNWLYQCYSAKDG